MHDCPEQLATDGAASGLMQRGLATLHFAARPLHSQRAPRLGLPRVSGSVTLLSFMQA